MIRVSVVVPTRNRFASLERCLCGLQEQSLDQSQFEVIVVDNGSTDCTRASVARMQEVMPQLRYAFEGTPGAARARNTGIDLARADIVAFVDDDAVPAARWLTALLDGYARWPQAGVLSGRTELRFNTRRPSWLHRDLETWYSARDLGPAPRLLATELPWGVNASLRRDAALDVGGFDVGVGGTGGRWLFNEDIDFFARVRDAGHVIAYVPDALVLHDVDPVRVSHRWLVRRAFAQGWSDALLEYRRVGAPPGTRRILRATSSALTSGWRGLAQGLASRERRSRALVDDLVRRGQHVGFACGSVSLWARRARSRSAP